jgi:hypothetical protein
MAETEDENERKVTERDEEEVNKDLLTLISIVKIEFLS